MPWKQPETVDSLIPGSPCQKTPHFALRKAVPWSRRLLWVPWALWRGAGRGRHSPDSKQRRKRTVFENRWSQKQLFYCLSLLLLLYCSRQRGWEHKHGHKHLKFTLKWPLTRFGGDDSSLWCHRNGGSACHLATSPSGLRQQRKAANAETLRTASVCVAPFSVSCTWKIFDQQEPSPEIILNESCFVVKYFYDAAEWTILVKNSEVSLHWTVLCWKFRGFFMELWNPQKAWVEGILKISQFQPLPWWFRFRVGHVLPSEHIHAKYLWKVWS